jgi:oxaloacetate decarboxylase gamma subunit
MPRPDYSLEQEACFLYIHRISFFIFLEENMTIPDMFAQSAALAVLGMSMVFGFLVIMVICVSLTGKVIHAIGADREDGPAPRAVSAATADSGAITAVISAAVTEHRKNQ